MIWALIVILHGHVITLNHFASKQECQAWGDINMQQSKWYCTPELKA